MHDLRVIQAKNERVVHDAWQAAIEARDYDRAREIERANPDMTFAWADPAPGREVNTHMNKPLSTEQLHKIARDVGFPTELVGTWAALRPKRMRWDPEIVRKQLENLDPIALIVMAQIQATETPEQIAERAARINTDYEEHVAVCPNHADELAPAEPEPIAY